MRRAATVVGALVCALTFAPGAVAKWTAQPIHLRSDIEDTSVLEAVSCAAPAACTAVGSGYGESVLALAARWNGASWSAQYPPNPANEAGQTLLEGVSCPEVSTCIAVGGYDVPHRTLAERWEAGTWTVQPTPSSSRPGEDDLLLAVSCSSAGACMAVGQSRNDTVRPSEFGLIAERWDGSAWTFQSIPNPPMTAHEDLSLHGVSCTSASACTAVGSTAASHEPLVERWNGSGWSVQPTPTAHKGVLFGVSCLSARWCVAVGRQALRDNENLAVRWNGKRWSVMRTPHSSRWFRAVSCASARACTATGADMWAERWNGRRWQVQKSSDRGYDQGFDDTYYGVSCPTRHDCTAVGNSLEGSSMALSIAERWTG